MSRALLIVDIQNDYFPGGAFPLPGAPAAGEVAAGVLRRFRASGDRVVHVQHVSPEPDAPFMRPGTEGQEIHPLVAPDEDEAIVLKEHPNAFVDTGLEARLREDGVEELVVVGMMSNMCVDGTVRAASDLGFEVTVVHDACAASDLPWNGRTVPAEVAHAAFMSALGDAYAEVVSAAELA